MRHLALTLPLLLAACGGGGVVLNNLSVTNGGPTFVSGTTPGSAGSASNAEPNPPGSLPEGGRGVGGGANAYRPDFGAITVGEP